MPAYLYPSKKQTETVGSEHYGKPVGTVYRYRCWIKNHLGERVKISGTPAINTKQAAQIEERKHIERVQAGRDQKRDDTTFKSYAETFIATIADSEANKPSEIASKRSILNTHLIPAWGGKKIAAITTADVEKLKASLVRGDKSKKRINNILHVVSKLFNTAIDCGLVPTPPKVVGYRLPRPGKLKVGEKFFSFEDYDRLVSASRVEPAWHAMVLLGGDAGLRLGEIVALRWRHVDLKHGQLTVCRSVWRGQEGTPKGRESRVVPMTNRLLAALTAIGGAVTGAQLVTQAAFDSTAHKDGSVFLSNTNMRSGLKRQEKRAGLAVTDGGWHILRHTFCSHLAMRGVPAIDIQTLAGHTTSAVTDRYMDTTVAHLQSAIARLGAATLAENLGQQVDKSFGADSSNPATN